MATQEQTGFTEDCNAQSAPAQATNEGRGGRALTTAIKCSLAALLVYFLVRRGDINPWQLWTSLSAHWLLGLLSMSAMALSNAVQAYRWDVILRDRQVKISFWQALRSLMIGKFFSLVVPGYLSEDVVRALYLIRLNAAPRALVFMSLIADRMMGIMTLFLVVASSLMALALETGAPMDARLLSLRTLTGLALGGFVVFVLLVRRYPQPAAVLRKGAALLHLQQILDSAYAEMHYYCSAARLQIKLLAISLANYALFIASFVILGYSLNMKVGLAAYCVFVPLGCLVTMIPIAPVGLGVGHVAFLALFAVAGSREGANLFSLYLAFGIPLNLIGGLFYLGLGRERSVRQMTTAVR